MTKITLLIPFSLFLVTTVFADWKDDFKKNLKDKEVMLRVDVYKIRFKDQLGFGIGTGHDVTNFDKTGFYYKSGVYKDDNPEELQNRIHAAGVEVFKAGSIVTITEVDPGGDSMKLKFKTTGDKGAVTFHFEDKDGADGFMKLYKQVFVVDNRREILAAHPEWPAATVEAIKKEEVLIGMDFTQVEATLGPPARVRKSKTAEGDFETWEYALATKGVHVTFSDGSVEKIEEVEGQ